MKHTELHINSGSRTWTLTEHQQQQVVLVFDDACTPDARELVFRLMGKEAQVDIIILVKRKAPELLQASLHVIHEAQNTKANVMAASVLDDSAAQDIRGIIHIQKGAKGADAFLSHRTLTLSATAKSRTEPILEIEEDDVKASHAGVTGPVDPEQLFYLQTRGVSTEEAQQVIAQGFLQAVMSKIQDPVILNKVKDLFK